MQDDYDVDDDIYREIDRFNNIEITSRRGRKTAIIHAQSYGKFTALGWVERFVKKVINSKNLPSKKALENHIVHQHIAQRASIVSYYPMLNAMRLAYDERYRYNLYVHAFFASCEKLGILEPGFQWKRDFYYGPLPGEFDYIGLFHALILDIKAYCTSKEFLDKLEEKKKQIEEQKANLLQWENRLFQWRSRHLLLHLTLKYKSEFRDELTLEIMQDHWQQLMNNKRMNAMLRGINHFIWHIEEGDDIGVHMHVIIAYDRNSNRDMQVVGQICDYFNDQITHGKGDAHADNFFKKSIERKGQQDGTGQIDADDREKREGLRTALLYLAKADQLLKRKKHSRVRTFGMSQIPEHSGLGRPRAAVND